MRRIVAIVAVLALVSLFPVLGGGKPPDNPQPRLGPRQRDKVKDLMQHKLTHAQKVLEGIALEDYTKIAQEAEELVLVSKRAEWLVVHTPKYELHSNEFRQAAEDLISNAKKHKLEAATLSYMEMTMSCVKCHKYVREIQEARMGSEDERPRWARR